MASVAGRLAVVTGAGSGIGRAACQVLSREGATVIAADKNYESAVETIKTHTALASGANGKTTFFPERFLSLIFQSLDPKQIVAFLEMAGLDEVIWLNHNISAKAQ